MADHVDQPEERRGDAIGQDGCELSFGFFNVRMLVTTPGRRWGFDDLRRNLANVSRISVLALFL